jgi:ABC-type proline/glycine betaine transport system ATPase subunit
VISGPRQQWRAAGAHPNTTTERSIPMENVEMTVEGDQLVIKVDLSKSFGLSGSGKSEIIATTRGNATVPGTDVKIGLNIYRRV